MERKATGAAGGRSPRRWAGSSPFLSASPRSDGRPSGLLEAGSAQPQAPAQASSCSGRRWALQAPARLPPVPGRGGLLFVTQQAPCLPLLAAARHCPREDAGAPQRAVPLPGLDSRVQGRIGEAMVPSAGGAALIFCLIGQMAAFIFLPGLFRPFDFKSHRTDHMEKTTYKYTYAHTTRRKVNDTLGTAARVSHAGMENEGSSAHGQPFIPIHGMFSPGRMVLFHLA